MGYQFAGGGGSEVIDFDIADLDLDNAANPIVIDPASFGMFRLIKNDRWGILIIRMSFSLTGAASNCIIRIPTGFPAMDLGADAGFTSAQCSASKRRSAVANRRWECGLSDNAGEAVIALVYQDLAETSQNIGTSADAVSIYAEFQIPFA